MHERERHSIIVGALQTRAVATVGDIVEMTGASEATIRRDLSVLALQGRLRKVRGGAESIHPTAVGSLLVRPVALSETINIAQKRAIAIEAAGLCADGDAIIINGGTTTFQMVHPLQRLRLQVLTNSFSIADHLLRHSKCDVFLPSGAVYRQQNIILSPFEDDGISHFRARRMFMGAQGVSHLGIMEGDPLIIQSEQRLMRQADELVLLIDSSKFTTQSSMILAPLERAATIITDDQISDAARTMVENIGLQLVIADTKMVGTRNPSASVA
ncbi:DeoR/GlpR family DNA-binding transcription regulator [Lichenihabitans psoromatis]|uniref:DeoR/GlpR family DNA-binding transcription regulator n=1 Tax=Lichenihabitans psoromatis TaxID=2528642 RepID=UPI001035BD8A|nr:DeoR/GlpR family DNA-binding transcription regulator [Lichenihabitans psoromatis]